MLNDRAFIVERIKYCCQRLHCDHHILEGALRLLDKIERVKPDLIIRKNPNVVAAQLVCLVARAQNHLDVTHTTLGNIMNTSAPSIGKYRHYLEPWVRRQHFMHVLSKMVEIKSKNMG